MSASTSILPANEAVLRARFPIVLHRLEVADDRPADSCFYEDTERGPRLIIMRGEHTFPVYGSRKRDKLIEFNGEILAIEHKTTAWYQGTKATGYDFKRLWRDKWTIDSQCKGYQYAGRLQYGKKFTRVLVDGALIRYWSAAACSCKSLACPIQSSR